MKRPNCEQSNNISLKLLQNHGIKIRDGSSPEERNYDPLERYKLIENHGVFLYTSEDSLIDSYIRSHWSALDGLSGDICDIHISMMQMSGDEDFYSQFDYLKTLPGLESIKPSDLPAFHIWSDEASLKTSLGAFEAEKGIKETFRVIFSEIIESKNKKLTHDLARKIETRLSNYFCEHHATQNISDAYVNGSIFQVTQHFHGERAKMSKTDENASKAIQVAKNIKSTGSVNQESGALDTNQNAEGIEGASFDQKAISEKQELSLGSYTASGKWAVIALAIVLIVFFVFQHLNSAP